MKKQLWSITFGAVITLSSSVASAAMMTFFGENLAPAGAVSGDPVTARADFLSNLVGVGNEDFEGLTAGETNPALSFPGSSGSITATLSGSGEVWDGFNGAGRFATSGTKFWETTGAFTIDFSDPISAFGFYGTDIGDFNGTVTLELVSGETTELEIPHTVNGPNGSLLFFGFIDDTNQYTSLTFGNTAPGTDFFGFDDMVIGDAEQIRETPVPATLALIGLGLLALRRFGRR